MGASVGIGALIVGVSMLVVFALAVEAFEQEVQSAVAEIEDSAETLPKVKIENANVASGAILDVTIDDPGEDCDLSTSGNLGLTGGTGAGFTGTWTTDANGEVIDVTITAHGSYSVLPTISASGITCATTDPSFSVPSTANGGWGNMVYFNLTNEGSETLEIEGFWFSANGGEPLPLSDNYSRDWIYPGETVYVMWGEASNNPLSRLAVNAAGTTVASSL